MDIVLYILILVFGVGIAFIWLLLIFRGSKVHRLRLDVINKIGELCWGDLSKGHGWRWRWIEFEKGPSHFQMLFSTRPITQEEWYPNARFLEPQEETINATGTELSEDMA